MPRRNRRNNATDPILEKRGRVYSRRSQWTRPDNHVGSGYFVLADWRPNQFVRLKGGTTYWDREHVYLNEVNFYPIDRQNAEE